jgi:hypothetical protein
MTRYCEDCESEYDTPDGLCPDCNGEGTTEFPESDYSVYEKEAPR